MPMKIGGNSLYLIPSAGSKNTGVFLMEEYVGKTLLLYISLYSTKGIDKCDVL